MNIKTICYFVGHKDHYILMKLDIKHHKYIFPGKLPGKVILLCAIILHFLFSSCNNNNTPPPQELVTNPQQMNETIPDVIKKIVNHITGNDGKIDSISILQPAILQYLYDKTDDEAKWSKEERWTSMADSLMNFIENSRLYGLFPQDYHFKNISFIKERFINDSMAKNDAVLWSRADVLLTDGLLQVIKDVKLGRLQKDSITLRGDSVLSNEFYEQQLQKIIQSN